MWGEGGVLPNPHPPGTDPALSKWGQQATCAAGTGTQIDGGRSRGREQQSFPCKACTCSPSTLDAALRKGKKEKAGVCEFEASLVFTRPCFKNKIYVFPGLGIQSKVIEG